MKCTEGADLTIAQLLEEYTLKGATPGNRFMNCTEGAEMTIAQLLEQFADAAPPGSRKNREIVLFRFKRFAPTILARQFDASQLLLFRGELLTSRYGRAGTVTRTYLNSCIRTVIAALDWGADRGLVPEPVCASVRAVRDIEPGEIPSLKEIQVLLPIDDTVIEATTPHMPPVIRAMVRLQRLARMRTRDLLEMTPASIDRRGAVWAYATPGAGKSKRRYSFGRAEQEILNGFLNPDHPHEPIFRPEMAGPPKSQSANAARHRARAIKENRLQFRYRPYFTSTAYSFYIRKACRRANAALLAANPAAELLPEWRPTQLHLEKPNAGSTARQRLAAKRTAERQRPFQSDER